MYRSGSVQPRNASTTHCNYSLIWSSSNFCCSIAKFVNNTNSNNNNNNTTSNNNTSNTNNTSDGCNSDNNSDNSDNNSDNHNVFTKTTWRCRSTNDNCHGSNQCTFG